MTHYMRRSVADILNPTCRDLHRWFEVRCDRAPGHEGEHHAKHPDAKLGDVKWPRLDGEELIA